MTADTVVTGGRLVTPERIIEGDIAIDNGTIVALGDPHSVPDAERTIDASGHLVFPGVVDPHVHIAGYLSKETYDRGTAAAAVGGVTSLVNFAWQAWVGELGPWEEEGTLMEAIRRQKRRGEDARVDYALHGVITREDPAVFAELDEVLDAGVSSIKMFTAYEIGLSNGFLHRAFDHLADRGLVAVLHTEDDSVCTALTERLKDEGRSDPTWYPSARPDYSEAMAVDDALRMARATGTKYYGVHTSCRAAADVFEAFRDDGSQIRAETCTHYTTLDESAYAEQGTLPICAPPLRSPDDRDALFEHLRRGTLGTVSTDHTVFERADKDVDHWWDSSFGINSVRYSLPVFHDEAINRRGMSYPFLVRVMSANPARTFGLPNKGTLEPGTDADIVIFDPDETYTITADDSPSVSDYTVYEGREVTGRVKKTLVRGTVVADGGEAVGDPGHGQFLRRDPPDWTP